MLQIKFFTSTALVLMLSLATARLAAQQLVVTVSRTTATQAILTYAAPWSSPCAVQVSQSPTLSPLIHDVDPVLFPGADADSRTGSTADGLQRTFVVGNRRSDLGSDNNLYSRALQANTLYYYQVTCDSETSTTPGQVPNTLITANPPVGNNFPNVPPYNSNGFGNYGWPTIDFSDQSASYVDPMTGIQLKRATGPGWYGQSRTGNTFAYVLDLNNQWTKAGNVLSGDPSKLASYSGTGNDPLFIAFDSANVVGFQGQNLTGWYPSTTLDNEMIRIFGSGTGTITGCLTTDSGATCASPPFDFVNLATAADSNPAGTYPASCPGDVSTNCFPNNGFWGGWNFTPVNWQLAPSAGAVDVDGTAVTIANSWGVQFNLNWKPGGKIYIAGSSCPNNLCTIASVNTSSSMTIVESAGTLTEAAYKTANTGFKIWVKPAGGTLTASISVNHDYAYSDQYAVGLNGTVGQCSSVPTTVSYAADGITPIAPVPGQLCLAGHQNGPSEVLYLLIPSTGETRLLSPIWFVNSSDASADQPADPVAGTIHVPASAFDSSDPNTIYAQVFCNGGTAIFKGVYDAATYNYKAYPHSLYPSATASYNPGQDTTQFWYRGPAWPDTGITWINLTKPSLGMDIDTQIAAGDTNYSGGLFHGAGELQIFNGQAFTTNAPMSNASPESMTLIHSFSLSTGLLALTTNTWSTWPARWCAMHAANIFQNWYGLICNPMGGTFGFQSDSGVLGLGPWQFTPSMMMKSGVFTADTSMTDSSPLDACPAIPSFLASITPSSPKCVTFQSQMACSQSPYPGENAKWPCEYNSAFSEIQPLAAGDGILVNNGTGTPEFLLIISVTSLGSMNYQFTAVRGATQNYQGVASGWIGYAVPPAFQCNPSNCTPGVGMWFNSTTGSVTWQLDPGAFSEHADLGNGPTSGASNFCQDVGCRFNVPMAAQIGQAIPTFGVSSPQPFAGGNASALTEQSYPSVHQFSAPATEQVWMTDLHHLNPSSGVGAEIVSNVGPVTYNLVSGTSTVYRFTGVNGGVSYKQIPLLSWAGYHLLQEVSSPATGNIITDSTPWEFCYAYNPGECQLGSAAGEVYASVPQSSTASFCVSNWYDDNYPCVATPSAKAAFGLQQGIDQSDPLGTRWRPLTMGFSGPGRQFQFASFIPDPTGTWAFMQGFWLNGSRNDLLITQLPPWPYGQNPSVDRSTFIPFQITIGSSPDLDLARVRFGYAENGDPSSFFCTARQENCSTTTDSSMPFAFESEEPVWQECLSGCIIQVPALPDRVLYYAIDQKSSSTGAVQSGNLMIVSHR